MSELFWRSVIYVMIRLKLLRPYLTIIENILNIYCGAEEVEPK